MLTVSLWNNKIKYKSAAIPYLPTCKLLWPCIAKIKEVICISFLFLSLCIPTWCYEVKKRNRYQNLSCHAVLLPPSWFTGHTSWARLPVNQGGGDNLHVQVFDCDLHYPTQLLHILANLGNILLYSHKRLIFLQISPVTVWKVAMYVQRCWY